MAKKQIPLRVSDTLYKELVAWAEADFRSLNGQIEFLLTECVRRFKKAQDGKMTNIDEISSHTGLTMLDDTSGDLIHSKNAGKS
ncbi:MAG: hypothetical protein LBL96_06955 [Clostridiales bacterium]|jgi:hypothetical protein|nr:hypothetical protein [Clostridiales bacterium]